MPLSPPSYGIDCRTYGGKSSSKYTFHRAAWCFDSCEKTTLFMYKMLYYMYTVLEIIFKNET